MKKTIGLLIMLLLLLCSLHAAARQAASTVQTIAGFINHTGSDYLSLTVSYDITSTDGGYFGINMDVSDAGNPNRYLIAPSATHEPGLRIGTMNLETTNQGYTLRIYHTPLMHTSIQNVSVDYELSLQYVISGGDTLRAYCLSASNMGNPDNKINVTLNTPGGVVLIQNAGLFFRLADASQVRTTGQYESVIYIQVGKE